MEFGAMEHEFETELMPMELTALFTWKPNVATNQVSFYGNWP